MNATLARLIHRHEVGLYVDETSVSAVAVAVSPWGRSEVGRATVVSTSEGLAGAVKEVLGACLRPADLAHAKVIIGLPAMRVFFTTRPVSGAQLDDTPQMLLHGLIRSSTFVINDMAVDTVKRPLGKRVLAGLASCRERYLAGVLAAVEAAGARAIRAEPGPCGLSRRAACRHRPPRKARALVRVFLGAVEGLAVLSTADGRPLCWRPIDLSAGPGTEGEAIVGAVGAVRALAVPCGLDAEVNAVMVHGRADLDVLGALAACPATAGLQRSHADGPTNDPAEIALGLTEPEPPGVEPLNLIRALVGPAKYVEVFPWGQAVVAAAVLIASTLFFSQRLRAREAAERATLAEDAKYAWAAKLPAEKLAAEKKALLERIEAVRGFLDTRVCWASYARTLASRLTPELAIVSIQGAYELESSGIRGKPKRSLAVRFNTPIPQTGTLPPHIDAFLRDLRAKPLLKRDFPEVDLADLRYIQANGTSSAMANFSVVCQPPKAPPPKPAEPEKGKGKGKGT